MKALLLFFVFLLILLLKADETDAGRPYVDDALLKRITVKYNQNAQKRFENLQKILDRVKYADDVKKLSVVNRFYNSVHYGSDMEIYGVKNYWATPWEFLGQNRGDCEDYVIAKYYALIYLGVDGKKLFFTYVRPRNSKIPHMVLTYFKTPRSEPLVLDNNSERVIPASKRTDLTPIYYFNGDTLYKARDDSIGHQIDYRSHKEWEILQDNMKRKKI
ncbi:transglutaminase-like cysteine peptidase [Sulfurimonas sp. HSL3-7]|uniref:transglutaminase-like cysteine peptidase n=1 Tax=Sulfonitrofixus jiaomeiensis TaxID=3131938 RepID=UPI0031F97FB6